MNLDSKAMYKEWKDSLAHAKPMPLLALVASLSGIGAYALKPKARGLPWLIAGGAMAALLPYTALVIWPFAIGPIYSEERAEKKGVDYAKEHIEKWNKLHAVRTVVSIAVFGWCVYNFKK
ncbi:uncharacterized protein LOC5512731 [Nematostella vectensis]|uniref:uncharacterized protein LOC5512731 n=1 Tax=Nematostella vectensis TaxID=45351 RepID=UPI002077932D|nr:uncharacterized protein LOC5512731 [Nematostella vectensis]